MLKASCHCGAVTIEVTRKPRSVTRCTCSLCRRYGARWAYCSKNTAKVSCEPDAIAAYRWKNESLEFFHCNRCGCLTHYESVNKDDNYRVAVNARMMEPSDIADVRVRTFDGANTWKYLDD